MKERERQRKTLGSALEHISTQVQVERWQWSKKIRRRIKEENAWIESKWQHTKLHENDEHSTL